MKLDVNLVQKQVLSQQMIQTLKVLEMNVTELEDYLARLAAENPVAELEPGELHQDAAAAEFHRQAEADRRVEWLSSSDRQNQTYYADDAADRGLNALQDPSSAGETLAEHLHAQLLLKKYTPVQRNILDFMARSLDSRGYFTEPIFLITDRFSVSVQTAEELLSELQALEPAGVGARNLKECLLLQLKRGAGAAESTETTALAEQIILSHLEDIAKNHLDLIARKRGVPLEEVTAACGLIRRLNPKPGNAFSDGSSLPYVRPDVLVVKEEGTGDDAPRFQALVNESRYTRIAPNSFYEALEKETDDPEAKKYLKEKLAQIAQVRSDLANRSSTLARVAGLLVQRQEAFFFRGPGFRQPMVLSDLAEPLSLHESTVSRTLKDKYLQCSWGVFPMNYFLNASAGDDSNLSVDHIKRALQEIIDTENKAKPLSDDKLCAALAERGIQIARRTVNKYRKELGIPDKSGRKKLPE